MIATPALRAAASAVAAVVLGNVVPVVAAASDDGARAGTAAALATVGNGPAVPGQPQLERRIGQLHAALRITPEQEGAWRGLADTMRTNAARTAAVDEAWRKRPHGTDAVSGLRLYGSIEQADAANAAALQQPFGQLYGLLSPVQRRTADAMMARYVDAQTRRRS